MARLPRLAIAGCPQHVLQRGNNRQPIFGDAADRERYLTLLLEHATRLKVAVLAYVLLDNHVHLLLLPSDASGLTQTMQALGRSYVRYFNDRHGRSGTLWEQRYKSVIVESGIAARTIAAYIDLNPVRAGLVKDPADYRWSSYGEAIGGGKKGNGKKAREGLVRACLSHRGVGFESEKWQDAAKLYRQMMGLALQRKSGHADLTADEHTLKAKIKGGQDTTAQDNGTVLPELDMAAMLRHRIRYFSDGAVIGSKSFVNAAFSASRERFSARRQDGARKMKGNAAPAASALWSIRDLRMGIS